MTTLLAARFGPGHTLSGLLEEATAAVRSDPARAKPRIALFQALCVAGQWDRALTQLQVLGELDAETKAMVDTCQALLRCERYRTEVFAGQRLPLFVGEPEPWIGQMAQAATLTAQGQVEQAEALRALALDAAPATGGRLDGTPFEWLADADSRLGPLLEAVVNGKYTWIPLNRLLRIDIEAPQDLRDLVWCPASFQFASGGTQVGFIPTRYPGTETVGTESHKLARSTEWQAQGEATWTGIGQRMLVTDAGEQALLDVRCIELDTPVLALDAVTDEAP